MCLQHGPSEVHQHISAGEYPSVMARVRPGCKETPNRQCWKPISTIFGPQFWPQISKYGSNKTGRWITDDAYWQFLHQVLGENEDESALRLRSVQTAEVVWRLSKETIKHKLFDCGRRRVGWFVEFLRRQGHTRFHYATGHQRAVSQHRYFKFCSFTAINCNWHQLISIDWCWLHISSYDWRYLIISDYIWLWLQMIDYGWIWLILTDHDWVLLILVDFAL